MGDADFSEIEGVSKRVSAARREKKFVLFASLQEPCSFPSLPSPSLLDLLYFGLVQ